MVQAINPTACVPAAVGGVISVAVTAPSAGALGDGYSTVSPASNVLPETPGLQPWRFSRHASAALLRADAHSPNAPFKVLERFSTCRVLVVDDHELSLSCIEQDLRRHFAAVDTIADPVRVIDLLRAAKESGASYDALVLDLRMPGMNGDALLRAISEEGLLIPTVIHSGSHASVLQHGLLPQIEDLRTEEFERRAREIDRVAEAFASVASFDAFERWRRDYVRLTDGVPLTFVSKRAWTSGREDFSHATLARALCRVIASGEETNWENFEQAVARFRPALWDGQADTEYIEALVEAARFVAGKALWLAKLLEERVPVIADHERWKDYHLMVGELSGPDYSHEKLRGELDAVDEAGRRRHALPVTLAAFAWFLEFLMDEEPDIGGAIRAQPDVLKELERFRGLSQRTGEFVRAFRFCRDKAMPVDLRNELHLCSIPAVRIEDFWEIDLTGIDDTGPWISAPLPLLRFVIEQPLLNALQWTEWRKGAVNMRLATKDVASLDARSRAYFREQHGLRDDDRVAMIEIADQGPGIAPEDLGRIFDFRYTTRVGGTGFGLAFVAKYMALMNGAYHVESELGAGTRFFLYFLLTEPPAIEGEKY
jgi:signal transduction histidine kinase